MERITFCAACGESTSYKAPRCTSCGAPLRRQRFRSLPMPRPTPLAILVAVAVVALGIAVVTGIVYR